MSERFQRLFCAGCFAVVLMALPGALREARQSLGGPYSVAARSLGSSSLALIAPLQAPLLTQGVPATTGTHVKRATRSPVASDPVRAVPETLAAEIRSTVTPHRPVLFRDGLARPGI